MFLLINLHRFYFISKFCWKDFYDLNGRFSNKIKKTKDFFLFASRKTSSLPSWKEGLNLFQCSSTDFVGGSYALPKKEPCMWRKNFLNRLFDSEKNKTRGKTSVFLLLLCFWKNKERWSKKKKFQTKSQEKNILFTYWLCRTTHTQINIKKKIENWKKKKIIKTFFCYFGHLKKRKRKHLERTKWNKKSNYFVFLLFTSNTNKEKKKKKSKF